MFSFFRILHISSSFSFCVSSHQSPCAISHTPFYMNLPIVITSAVKISSFYWNISFFFKNNNNQISHAYKNEWFFGYRLKSFEIWEWCVFIMSLNNIAQILVCFSGSVDLSFICAVFFAHIHWIINKIE